jgi:hypothetical protein
MCFVTAKQNVFDPKTAGHGARRTARRVDERHGTMLRVPQSFAPANRRRAFTTRKILAEKEVDSAESEAKRKSSGCN